MSAINGLILGALGRSKGTPAAEGIRRHFVSIFRNWSKGVIVSAAISLATGTPAAAATFVYVSNVEDGDIGTYRLLDSGELQPGARAKAASIVMPMAASPDRRFLYAA